MLARAVGRGDYVDPGQLVRAAIRVMDELPEDEDLAAIADNLCGAAFDWAYFDGTRQGLANAVQAYVMAGARDLAGDEFRPGVWTNGAVRRGHRAE